MQKRSIILLIICLTGSATAYAEGGHHWSYSGSTGPEHWGEISKEFTVCSSGRNQTPINLTGFIDAKLPAIKFDYSGNATEILNNGHAIQINYSAGNTITVGEKKFELKQFHFHSPSENQIEGEFFPLEAHFVHADKEGHLAVVTVMFKDGPANKALTSLWNQMPAEEGDKNTLSSAVNAKDLLPSNQGYYRFSGSLTTPPCTEGVLWLVMKNPVSISKDQIARFVRAMGHPNNRPLQPVGARAILQ